MHVNISTGGTAGVLCQRCGRTDLPLLSNGLCTRCDEVLYGRSSNNNNANVTWSNYPHPNINITNEPEEKKGE